MKDELIKSFAVGDWIKISPTYSNDTGRGRHPVDSILVVKVAGFTFSSVTTLHDTATLIGVVNECYYLHMSAAEVRMAKIKKLLLR